jgi:glycosyltransferase involved in cell wall biosynthesis
MKRCLFVFAHPAPYKVNLFNGLSQFLDLTVVFQRQLGSYSQQQYLPESQYRFRYFFLKGLKLGKENHLSLTLIDHIRKHPYDLIIMNGYSSLTEILTIRYLIRKKIPYYLYVNGGVIRQDHFLKRNIKRHLISNAAGYFSPSAIVDPYLIHYGANPHRIKHYPYSTIFEHEIIPQPLTSAEKMTLRKTIGLPLEGKICITIGQFIPRKNFKALIEQWTNVDPTTTLIIVGDGPEKSMYEKRIKRLKLKNIILKPFQPKNLLLSMLRASDGFILLSKEDIYGHVVNEALSQGIPVLTSDQVISGKVLVQPGLTGLTMPLKDLSSLNNYIQLLLSKTNAQVCLQTAREYTIENMVAAHRHMLSQLGN